tara:strand:- start:166 stop:663 length:498 start_codon:yes stop_codon:yes gene_type:complete
MIEELIKLADYLDHKGLSTMADKIDLLLKNAAYSKKQLEVFDGDGDGNPFEPEDFKHLRSDNADDMDVEVEATSIDFDENTGTLEIEGELVDEGRNFSHRDCDARMTREQIYKIRDYADKLYEMLNDDDHLPSWIESKIAVMADGIGKIKHHLEYKVIKMEESGE